QVMEGLKQAEFRTGNVETLPPEGMMAPDSYEVKPGADRGELVAKMVAAQEAILAAAWANRAEGLPYETRLEALTMASIVEKETGIAGERPLVASVFVNRLRQGMRLQTDPTVIYGVTQGRSVLGRGLRQSELRGQTPYNTYVIDGLPPTPIANPGKAAIEAALHPADSEYIFFVADGTGGHAFAKTLAEHNRNVAAWRAIEAERGN
ncbi:MAG TPA: endolytic transglycosylase MltG, partial [Aliiroseovarius sp.]|nr:endolytic transglycosylase MltG [Aliiroseovarius sp.]